MSLKSTSNAVPRSDVDRRAFNVVAGATVVMALGFGGLALMSVFMRPLEVEFGWSRSEVSFVYAVATVGMAVGGVIWGRISDRVDIRILLAIGGSGMVLSLLAMAATRSLWQIYLANLVLGGFGFSVLYAPLVTATGEWFDRRRGLAVGVVTAGGALGQGVVPFMANMLIDSIGWRAAFLSLAFLTLVALSLALPRITRPDDVAAARAPADNGTVGRKRPQLVLLSIAAFSCCVCMGVPLIHLVGFVGMVCSSSELGAASLLVAMLFGAAGRVWFGLTADRIGYLPSYALASAIQTACVFVYPLLGGSSSLLALSAVFGFGFAGNMTCIVLCVREIVPAHRYGGALGMVMLVAWAGMGTGGYVGGLIYDHYLSYTLSFMLAGSAGLLNLVAIGLLMILRRSTARLAPSVANVVAA
ncbi:MAG: MFS transporter [Hyphomicrobiaceae bacterium]|nr:MFS transporter [Hyphomicrobiaceae bacterium]